MRNSHARPRVSVAIPVPVFSGRFAAAAETAAEAGVRIVAVIAARIVAEVVTAGADASNAGPAVVTNRTAGITAIPATGIRAVRN